MPATHRLKPVEVQAFQFTGGRVDALPDWAQHHKGMTSMGEQVIAKDAVGQLLVPVNGGIVTCKIGDYLVLSPTVDPDTAPVLRVVSQRDFDDTFEPLEAPAAPEATEQ